MKYDYNLQNQFRYRFKNKETGITSYFNGWCYGNIYQQINIYKNDLSKMCLIGVNNQTHKLIEVINLMTGETLFKDDEE